MARFFCAYKQPPFLYSIIVLIRGLSVNPLQLNDQSAGAMIHQALDNHWYLLEIILTRQVLAGATNLPEIKSDLLQVHSHVC